MDRREFTKRAVSATIAAAGIGSASSLSSCRSPEGKEEPSIPASAEELSITDTHQHLWDLEKFQPPWLETAPPVLARSYVTKDYLAAAEGTGARDQQPVPLGDCDDPGGLHRLGREAGARTSAGAQGPPGSAAGVYPTCSPSIPSVIG